jgi:hypothetical protein
MPYVGQGPSPVWAGPLGWEASRHSSCQEAPAGLEDSLNQAKQTKKAIGPITSYIMSYTVGHYVL